MPDSHSNNVMHQLLAGIRDDADSQKSIARLGELLRSGSPPVDEVSRLDGIMHNVCRSFLTQAKAVITEATCDFCQRRQADVFWLVRGPLTTICDQCVTLAKGALDEARLRKKPGWYRVMRRLISPNEKRFRVDPGKPASP